MGYLKTSQHGEGKTAERNPPSPAGGGISLARPTPTWDLTATLSTFTNDGTCSVKLHHTSCLRRTFFCNERVPLDGEPAPQGSSICGH